MARFLLPSLRRELLYAVGDTIDPSKYLFQFLPQSPSPFPFSIPQPFSLTRIIIDLPPGPPATPDRPPNPLHELSFHSHQLLPTLLLRAPLLNPGLSEEPTEGYVGDPVFLFLSIYPAEVDWL